MPSSTLKYGYGAHYLPRSTYLPRAFKVVIRPTLPPLQYVYMLDYQSLLGRKRTACLPL